MAWAEASPGSLMNGLFKIIFPLKLSCWLKGLSPRRMAQSCLPKAWTMNMQSWVFPSVTTHGRFKTIFHLKILCWCKVCLQGEQLEVPSPRIKSQSSVSLKPEQWMCRAEASQVSLMHGLFKTILSLKLSYWLKGPSPGRIVQSSFCQKSWKMNVRGQGMLGSPMKGLFKPSSHQNYHIASKLCLPGEQFKAVFSRDLNNEHAEQFLPKCHQSIAFSDHLPTKTYHTNSKLSPERTAQMGVFRENDLKLSLWETWTVNLQSQGFPRGTGKWHFETTFPLKLSYQLAIVSQET